jgi:hypothetical protein
MVRSLIYIDLCVVTACLTLSSKVYIPLHRLPLKTRKNAAFMSTSQGLLVMSLRDFKKYCQALTTNSRQLGTAVFLG